MLNSSEIDAVTDRLGFAQVESPSSEVEPLSAVAGNPFALIMDPGAVRQMMDRSEQLSQLSQRKYRPLDSVEIRSPTAELAAYDAQIDRTTIYLPPEEQSMLKHSFAEPRTGLKRCMQGDFG